MSVVFCQVEVSATGRSLVKRMLCNTVCDLETSRTWRSWPALGCCTRGTKILSQSLPSPTFFWPTTLQTSEPIVMFVVTIADPHICHMVHSYIHNYRCWNSCDTCQSSSRPLNFASNHELSHTNIQDSKIPTQILNITPVCDSVYPDRCIQTFQLHLLSPWSP